MDILVKSGRVSKGIAFGFCFGAVPPFFLPFHVFMFMVGGGGGGIWGGTQVIISRSENLYIVYGLSLGHLV